MATAMVHSAVSSTLGSHLASRTKSAASVNPIHSASSRPSPKLSTLVTGSVRVRCHENLKLHPHPIPLNNLLPHLPGRSLRLLPPLSRLHFPAHRPPKALTYRRS